MVNEKIKQELTLAADEIDDERGLEWSAACEAGVDVVPPFKLIAFTKLPAQ